MILVVVIVVLGIVILRFSRASETPSKVVCNSNTETRNFINNKVASNKTITPSQQCLSIAFLNRYTDYHQKTANLSTVSAGNNEKASTSAASDTATATTVPNQPTANCSGLPYSKPTEASYPVVEGSDEFKSPNRAGRKFTITTANWLGATGNCFYDNMNAIHFNQPIYPDMAWCAMFVSYVYAANGYPMSSYTGRLVYTVNQLVSINYDRLVPNQLVLDGKYTPQAGDMVIYEDNGDGFYDHVGVVTSTVENPTTKKRYIISNEGNVRVDPNNHVPYVPDSTNIVGMRARALDNPIIVGYVRAPGNELPTPPSTPPPYNASDLGCPNNIVNVSPTQYLTVPTQVIGISSRNLVFQGGCVLYIQKLINSHNRTANTQAEMLAEDSWFGPKTEVAVKQYQQANGLSVDGIAGPQTWNSIINKCYIQLLCYK